MQQRSYPMNTSMLNYCIDPRDLSSSEWAEGHFHCPTAEALSSLASFQVSIEAFARTLSTYPPSSVSVRSVTSLFVSFSNHIQSLYSSESTYFVLLYFKNTYLLLFLRQLLFLDLDFTLQLLFSCVVLFCHFVSVL